MAENKKLVPQSLGAVRKARLALQGKSQELLDEFRAMIKQAAASGKYEEALKAQQWLLDHVPAEDGERIFDPSSDKAKEQEKAPQSPIVNIGFQLGGLAQPKQIEDKVIEAQKINE